MYLLAYIELIGGQFAILFTLMVMIELVNTLVKINKNVTTPFATTCDFL
jgi:hypothetical protein